MSEHSHSGEHWDISIYPLIISVGVLLFIPLAFSFHYVYDNAIATYACLGLGLILTVYGVAGWTAEGTAPTEEVGLATTAMPTFILAEAFLFAGFFAAYWVVRLSAGSNEWPPEGTPHISTTLPLIMTVLLVSSSFTIHYAEEALEEGNEGKFKSLLFATIALGLAFFCCTAYEWSHLIHIGFLPTTNIYGTALYCITGFHASHVFVGLAIFIFILYGAAKNRINHTLVAAGSMYWHFVDIIWFFVASQIYFW